MTIRKGFLRCMLLFTLLAGRLAAATITIDPVSGIVTGSPGDTVGWGFSAYNTDLIQWISFSQSVLINETNPLLGLYTDLIGPQGGPNNFSLDPNSTWSQGFDLGNQSGLGFFLIDPSAIVGSSDSGLIRVFFNLEDGTPDSIDLPFTVQVQASGVPEPGSWCLLLLGVAILAGRRLSSAPS
jgi:hypothetical protein